MQNHSNKQNASYLFYILEKRQTEPKYSFKVLKRRPHLESIHSVLWTILSLGRFRRYELLVKGLGVVTTAEIMPRIPIFCFMKSEGLHIGPCVTKKEYRGCGFYPLLLQEIVTMHKEKICYIFCHQSNYASIRGIEKAGGRLYARGYKTRLGFYVISEYVF